FSPWHHGMLGYGRVAEKYKYELPLMLKEAGYYTYGIGKMHWHPQRNLHGFHELILDESGRRESEEFISDYHQWFEEQSPGSDPNATGIGWNEHRAGTYALDEKLHPTFWTGQKAVEFIKDYEKEEPLLLKVSFSRPHSPYDPPQRFLDMYKNVDVPGPVVGEWTDEFKNYPNTKSAAFGDFGYEYARNSRKYYYANISFIDEQLGEILNALKKKGMYEDALIMFSSDHGDMLGDHHHWRKTYAYQGSANIPFLMKWPSNIKSKVDRGSRMDYPVELRDFLPTFLDAAGKDVPEDMDGKSLLTLVEEKNPEWREYIDMEHSRCYRKENNWCALTDGKMKYIYFFYEGKEQLFDLIKDPGEITDLVEENKSHEDLKLWRKRMVDHLSERGEDFVKDGKLMVRKESMLYSPNYPGK
ncbi:arylsulfatase, partial [Bacteroidota bacterium]